ncbi:MAG: methionyl-tRNA formyltransferase [Brevundimonas sp.]|nr:MAG: methionyl-tRNA formyltransferase [Brevundimonas sp.]
MGPTYVLACRTPWALAAFANRRERLPGRWHILTAKADLSRESLAALRPRYVFFPHWSWIVPAPVIEEYECVCFHMTDVPYGRGGSPLQNLIARGRRDTVLTALRMDESTDTGPVYFKVPLSLEGDAEAIYRRAAELSLDLMERIIAEEPEPTPQVGDPVLFTRRRPEESRLPTDGDAERLYDHIRMLDAAGYPHAFTDLDDWRLTFTDASHQDDQVSARVRFTRRDDEGTR